MFLKIFFIKVKAILFYNQNRKKKKKRAEARSLPAKSAFQFDLTLSM